MNSHGHCKSTGGCYIKLKSTSIDFLPLLHFYASTSAETSHTQLAVATIGVITLTSGINTTPYEIIGLFITLPIRFWASPVCNN